MKSGGGNYINKREIGRYGEIRACEYLEKQGYKIITKNFWTKMAEIDIIMLDKEEYVFVEVKTRNSMQYGKPIEAVDINKQKHMIMAAQYYIYINSLEDYNVRFDVIEVYIYPQNEVINHIKGVFF